MRPVALTLKVVFEHILFLVFGGFFSCKFVSVGLLLKQKLVLKLILYREVNRSSVRLDYMFSYGKNMNRY